MNFLDGIASPEPFENMENLSDWLPFVLVVILVSAAAVGIVLLLRRRRKGGKKDA